MPDILSESLKHATKMYDVLASHPEKFVHFTRVHKMGVNIRPAHGDPIGVYFYPVRYVLDHGDEQTYGVRFKYYYLVDVDMSDVIDLSTAKESQLSAIAKQNGWGKAYAHFMAGNDLDALTKFRYISTDAADMIRAGHPGAVWYCCAEAIRRGAMGALGDVLDQMQRDRLLPPEKFGQMRLYRGVTGILDRGVGIMHRNEPAQMVVFSPRYVRTIAHGEIGMDSDRATFGDITDIAGRYGLIDQGYSNNGATRTLTNPDNGITVVSSVYGAVSNRNVSNTVKYFDSHANKNKTVTISSFNDDWLDTLDAALKSAELVATVATELQVMLQDAVSTGRISDYNYEYSSYASAVSAGIGSLAWHHEALAPFVSELTNAADAQPYDAASGEINAAIIDVADTHRAGAIITPMLNQLRFSWQNTDVTYDRSHHIDYAASLAVRGIKGTRAKPPVAKFTDMREYEQTVRDLYSVYAERDPNWIAHCRDVIVRQIKETAEMYGDAGSAIIPALDGFFDGSIFG